MPRPREKNYTGSLIGAAIGGLLGGPIGAAAVGALGGGLIGTAANPEGVPVPLKDALASYVTGIGLRFVSFEWLSPRKIRIGFGRGGNYFQGVVGVKPHPTKWKNRAVLEDALYDNAVRDINHWVAQFGR